MQSLELTPEQRARVAVHLKRFVEAIRQERAFDEKVAASIERLARNPAFRQRLAALDLSSNKGISNP
jgi:hypothetical protein